MITAAEALRLPLPPTDRVFLLELLVTADETGFAATPPDDWSASCRLRRSGRIERAARLVEGTSGLQLERGFTLRPCNAVPPVRVESLPCNASARGEHALLDALARGDRRAERQLAAMHLGTAERLALRLAPSNVPRDEARAAAPEALLRALRTFDASHGAAFPTHLCWCVRSTLRDLGRLYGAGDDELAADAGPTFDPREGVDLDLSTLPSDLRLIAVDLAEGWSPEESAARRGLSVHQVRRARTRVRESLRTDGVGPLLAAPASR